MKKHILLFLLAATTTLLTAQDFDEVHPCGTHLIQPAQSSWVDDQAVLQTTTSNTEKIIPVVFHIFHESGLENISRENVLLALERLNKDFDNNHENLPQTPEVFRNIAADVDVRFVLATKDPQGNCTDGINRYYNPSLSTMQLFPSNASTITQYQWDYQKYLNIFVPKSFIWQPTNSSYISASDGVAIFPVGDVYGFNGIILSHRFFLFSQNGIFADETITHEVGHWLNLWHIWGPNNNFPFESQNCSDSDEVSDTPNQSGPSNKCLSDFPFISCNNGPNGNMICNYMDYGRQPNSDVISDGVVSKGCLTMFTNGQKNRMQSALNNTSNRQNLWTPTNLDFTGTNQWTPNFSCSAKPQADFSTNQPYNFISCDTNYTITFQDRCFNGKADSLRWFFPGGTPSVGSGNEVIVSYQNAGQYSVTLIASNIFGSDTITRSINVKQPIDLAPYSLGNGLETFENANTVGDVGAVFQFTGGVNFKISNTGYNSTKSIECPMGINQYYRLRYVTKKFTIGIQDSIFSFYFTHRGEEDLTIARRKGIRVVASYNCRDVSTERSIGLLVDDELETTTVGNPNANYIPTSPNQWKEINFVIPPQFRGRDDVQFQFNYTADRTNNLYIDNIRVRSSIMTSTDEPENSFDWNIYPNPTDNDLSVEFKQIGNPMSFNVYDINGRLILTEQVNGNAQRISTGNLLPAGFYICKLVNEKGFPIGETKKLIKY